MDDCQFCGGHTGPFIRAPLCEPCLEEMARDSSFADFVLVSLPEATRGAVEKARKGLIWSRVVDEGVTWEIRSYQREEPLNFERHALLAAKKYRRKTALAAPAR